MSEKDPRELDSVVQNVGNRQPSKRSVSFEESRGSNSKRPTGEDVSGTVMANDQAYLSDVYLNNTNYPTRRRDNSDAGHTFQPYGPRRNHNYGHSRPRRHQILTVPSVEPDDNMWSPPGSFNTVNSSPNRFLESQGSPYTAQLLSVLQSADDGLHHRNMTMSGHMPRWAWYFLAKSLGIKLGDHEKPWFATMLHVVTLTAAFSFGICGAWYTVYDILSEYSKTTVLIGSVTIMIGFAWILLGIYAHKLAGRLFSNKNFAQSVRMHSKTFLKISTAVLLTFIGSTLAVITCYDEEQRFNGTTCINISLDPMICHFMYVSSVLYMFFCLLWNILVGFVLLSVCRTHTIGIRRFMRELSVDARAYEAYWTEHILGMGRGKTQNGHPDKRVSVDDEEEWFIWDDELLDDFDNPDIVTSQTVFLESIKGPDFVPNLLHPGAKPEYRHSVSEIIVTPAEETNQVSREDNSDEQDKDGSDSEQSDEKYPDLRRSDSSRFSKYGTCIMSNDDLLFSYWKLCWRFSVTSRYLQRWLSSWTAFILIWCANYIIYWATHGATLTGIMEFILPLLLLLIVCSAYAEVNSEGQRMLRCICPMEDRLSVLFFFQQQPLQMQVFGFAITYNTILGVVLAFSVAFASRIILDEVF